MLDSSDLWLLLAAIGLVWLILVVVFLSLDITETLGTWRMLTGHLKHRFLIETFNFKIG